LSQIQNRLCAKGATTVPWATGESVHGKGSTADLVGKREEGTTSRQSACVATHFPRFKMGRRLL